MVKQITTADINADTIEYFRLAADGLFSVRFKDGSVLKWKAKGCTYVAYGDAQLGVPVFPASLCIGSTSPTTGGKCTRCMKCGTASTEQVPLLFGLCQTCLPAEKLDNLSVGLNEFIQCGMEEMYRRVASAVWAHPPPTEDELTSQTYTERIAQTVFEGKR